MGLPMRRDSILVVEDEIFIAMALEAYLQDAGAAHVEIATSLSDAAEALEAWEFTAAILDIRLPDGQSYDLAEMLLARGTPVIFHSGHADQADRLRMPRAAFCAKPTTPDRLVACVLEAKARIAAEAPQRSAVNAAR